mgnify:CR=1 FL=1
MAGLENWDQLTPRQRAVFFCCDGLKSNAKLASQKTQAIGICGQDIFDRYYLDNGNEARIKAAYDKLNTVDDVQLIAIGCPHLTEKEMHQIAAFLKGKKKVNKDIEIWFCTSEEVRAKCPEDVRIMEEFGPVLADTCMVVAPIEGSFQRTGTNSAKAGNYLPTLCSQKAICRDIPALMELVM